MRVYETMTVDHVGAYRIRAWVVVDTPNAIAPNPDVVLALDLLKMQEFASPKQISDAIEKVPGIAAYEITDWRGNGFVIYTEWP